MPQPFDVVALLSSAAMVARLAEMYSPGTHVIDMAELRQIIWELQHESAPGSKLTLGRISETSHGIRLVRLNSDHDALVQQHLDPQSESDDNRHPNWMDSPVAPVDPRDFGLVRDDLGDARNCWTVFASHVTDDTRIPSHPPHLIRTSRRKEFDLSRVHNQPYLYLL
jgi:hypothetical protein